MSERPDLAVLMFDYSTSGVVRNALRIARAAQDAGIRTEVWTAQRIGEMADAIPPAVHSRSLEVDLGDIYSAKDRKRAMACVSTPLAGMMAQLRPRVVLSAGNHFHKPAVAAFSQLARQTAPRLVGRVSNALPRFSWRPTKLPSSLFKRINARRRYLAMDRLVAVSAEVRSELETQLLVNPSRITVIPNGIDIAEVERLGREPLAHRWFDAGEPPVIVASGRLTHQKGFDVLFRAFALARASRPMRLIVLGKGPEQSQLQALAEQLGIEADIELSGHATNPLPYLRRAALFVLPSRWEGLSNALLEAMASGTPVVATRCTGSTEVLDRGRYGSLVGVGDVDELARSIADELGRERPRDELIRRASEYDLARTLRAYVNLFHEELTQAG
jgi:glycosyltransferase involved in cell wall biosynthesis